MSPNKIYIRLWSCFLEVLHWQAYMYFIFRLILVYLSFLLSVGTVGQGLTHGLEKVWAWPKRLDMSGFLFYMWQQNINFNKCNDNFTNRMHLQNIQD